MGSALSTGGGLTESQKKRAKIMDISFSDFKQMLLNKQKIETTLIKKQGANKQSPVTKKKSIARSSSHRKRS